MSPGTQTNPTGAWSRREKTRLGGLIVLLLFVLYAIKWSADPDHWKWLIPPPPRAGEIEKTKGQSGALVDEVPFETGVDSAAGTQGQPRDDAKEVGGKIEAGKYDDLVVPESLLKSVQDNTLGVRSAEAEAFYSVLARARNLADVEQSGAAKDETAYTVLMSNAAHYRGRLVTISGQIRRLNALPVEQNDAGIDRLYEAWMFTADAGNNPIRVVVTSIPEGMPLGESDRLRGRVTGYFFKLQGYEAQSGLHTAPLLLAKELKQLPSVRPAIGPSSSLNMLLTAGLVLVALGAGFIRWQTRYHQTRANSRSVRSGRTEHFREPLPEKVDIPVDDARESTADANAVDTENSTAEPNEPN